ncbi:MAG: MBL fold metallo-hydrolase [Candidatus Micrarchaeaceae archaeon]
MRIEDKIFWVNHACFYIKAKDATIFIDPFRVSDSVREKADLILITHAHQDHNSKPDIEKVSKKGTKFVAPQKCFENNEYRHELSKPGFVTSHGNISIKAVHAYNLREDRLKFHPKSEEWVGYVIDVDGTRIYHAGDTDVIPEMNALKDIDIALLPMGGTYTMDMNDAIEAAKIINPKIIIPMHYKMLLGKLGAENLETQLESRLPNAKVLREVQEPIYSF